MTRTTLISPLLATLLFLAGCGGTPTFSGEQPRPIKPAGAVEGDLAVYFSPQGGAMDAILREINGAQHTIDVMAYLITAKEIADALEGAVKRGVGVRVIMDAGNAGGIYSDKAVFAARTVPIWRDSEHKEFHHKVMLIDGRLIITGSFNFTSQAENTNGENLLLIRNHPRVYAAYLTYFNQHLEHSAPPPDKAVAGK